MWIGLTVTYWVSYLISAFFAKETWDLRTVKPVINDHPLGPEKAVFSGRRSLVRGFNCTTISERETVRPCLAKWSVVHVPGWSLVTVVFSYKFYCIMPYRLRGIPHLIPCQLINQSVVLCVHDRLLNNRHFGD